MCFRIFKNLHETFFTWHSSKDVLECDALKPPTQNIDI